MHKNPNIEANEEKVIIDPHVWKKSGMSRLDFVKRIRGVKAIRVREIECSQEATGLPVFSYLPRNLESWGLLERFHRLVNEGDFSVFDERANDFIIAIVIAPSLAHWLFNTKIAVLQLQILNWLAGWLTWHSELPDKKIAQLPAGIVEKVESIQRVHYGQQFCVDELWGKSHSKRPLELLKHYEDITKKLTNTTPPEILKIRTCELENIDLESWGLSRVFDFGYSYIYIRGDDWERYVVRGEICENDRVESSEELRQKWLHTFELYPTRKSHVFGIIRDNEFVNCSTAKIPQVPESVRNKVLQYHNYICFFDGRTRPEFVMHAHHVISKNLIKRLDLPERLFTARENLVCACSCCNTVKSADITQKDVRFYLTQFANSNHPNYPLLKFLDRIEKLQQES
jgi:5-methylcytosine-specific restriction endonuclease McrA